MSNDMAFAYTTGYTFDLDRLGNIHAHVDTHAYTHFDAHAYIHAYVLMT